MKHLSFKSGGRRRALSAASAVLLLGAMSACSAPEPQREFETPKALCNTPVAPERLDPVLPKSGKKISTRSSDLVGYDRCVVMVDGLEVLSATREWLEARSTASSVAYSMRGVKIDHVDERRRSAWGERGAVSQVSCPNPTESHRLHGQDMELWVRIFTSNGGTPNKKAMHELVVAYAKALSESDECTSV